MRIPLTQYGWREIAVLTAVCAALATTAALAFPPAVAVPAAAWLYVLAFFRDPQRRADEPGGFLSPADGRIADIGPVDAGILTDEPATRIGIFMSLFDVHVNRSPCAARVLKVERHAGGFVDARRAEASDKNESSTIVLAVGQADPPAAVIVRQIAGLIARRIVTDLEVGQELSAGQRIGMIKFGSRVELIVPRRLVGQVAVKLGQHVAGGKTVLVRPPEAKEKP